MRLLSGVPPWKNCARLLSATAIERMAVVSGVTVVPNARIAGVALTGLHGYKAVAAMGKTLELDGGKRVLRKQEGGRAHKSDEPLFHTFPHASAAHCTAVIFRVDEFSATGAADLATCIYTRVRCARSSSNFAEAIQATGHPSALVAAP